MKPKQKRSVPVGNKRVVTPKAPSSFKDRNLMGVNPLKEQFEPTTGEAIRQHHRMAGY